MRHPDLIYQCWNGPELPAAAQFSHECFQAYAELISADYSFDHNERYTGKHCRYFDMLRPVLDPTFDAYRTVCVADLDVYPVDGLAESIFDEPVRDLAMAEEPDARRFRDVPIVPHITTALDERWAALFPEATLPRNEQGLRVFNSGVVLFSRDGRRHIRNSMWSIGVYQRKTRHLPGFYQWDQMFLHSQTFVHGWDFTELPVEWNRQVHNLCDTDGKLLEEVYDKRTKDTKMVHVQMRGANNWSAERIREVVNAPV